MSAMNALTNAYAAVYYPDTDPAHTMFDAFYDGKLALADLALKKGCWDDASALYGDVLVIRDVNLPAAVAATKRATVGKKVADKAAAALASTPSGMHKAWEGAFRRALDASHVDQSNRLCAGTDHWEAQKAQDALMDFYLNKNVSGWLDGDAARDKERRLTESWMTWADMQREKGCSARAREMYAHASAFHVTNPANNRFEYMMALRAEQRLAEMDADTARGR
jgi:hypothetical protein